MTNNTVMSKLVTINAPGKDVIFNGVDFTEEAKVEIKTAKSVSFLNCRFFNVKADQPKTYLIRTERTSEPCKIVIEHCYFGDNKNPASASNKLYNLIELHGPIDDGTSISFNYFEDDCCTHNQINFYDAKDSEKPLKVTIEGNYCRSSRNMARLGFRRSPNCILEFVKNRYDITDEGEYAGIMLIQPCGAETKSFNKMKVNIRGTINRTVEPQLIYMYAGGSDTPFNRETNYPVVAIDGKRLVDVPYTGSLSIEDKAPVEEKPSEIPPVTVPETPTTTPSTEDTGTIETAPDAVV